MYGIIQYDMPVLRFLLKQNKTNTYQKEPLKREHTTLQSEYLKKVLRSIKSNGSIVYMPKINAG